MKSDTYTRQQIVRKLKQLHKGLDKIKLSKGDWVGLALVTGRKRGLDMAIAAFPPAKEK